MDEGREGGEEGGTLTALTEIQVSHTYKDTHRSIRVLLLASCHQTPPSLKEAASRWPAHGADRLPAVCPHTLDLYTIRAGEGVALRQCL